MRILFLGLGLSALTACMTDATVGFNDGEDTGDTADTNETDTDTDADSDADTDTDNGQDPQRDLTVKVYTPDGDPIGRLSFDFCYGSNISDPADCSAWNEDAQVVLNADHIQWSSDVMSTGVVRFNTGFDYDGNGTDENWLCYGQSNHHLTAEVEVWYNGVYFPFEDDVVGSVQYDTGCSAYIDIDELEALASQ